MNIRKTVKARLKELGWTRYKLAKAVGRHMSAQSVYQYLAGEQDMRGENLSKMLDVIGLELRPKDRP